MITQELIDFIKKWEGVRYSPYLCPAGVPTIGAGFTTYLDGTRVKLTDPPITDEEVNKMLRVKLDNMDVMMKGVLGETLYNTLPQKSRDALISFIFNLGIGNFSKSTLLKRIKENKNDFIKIKGEFDKWVKGGGKTLPGLVKRRKAEFELYLEGILGQYSKRELVKMILGL